MVNGVGFMRGFLRIRWRSLFVILAAGVVAFAGAGNAQIGNGPRLGSHGLHAAQGFAGERQNNFGSRDATSGANSFKFHHTQPVINGGDGRKTHDPRLGPKPSPKPSPTQKPSPSPSPEPRPTPSPKPSPSPTPSPLPPSLPIPIQTGGHGASGTSGIGDVSAPITAPAPVTDFVPESAPPASAAPPAPPSVAAPNGDSPSISIPAADETRFLRDQLLVYAKPGVSPDTLHAILLRHRLVEIEQQLFELTGQTLLHWRIPDGRPVAVVLAELTRETALASAQPNFLYTPLQDAAPAPAAPVPGMYALGKLHVGQGLDLFGAAPIKVALIDTAVDESHPDLAGVVFDRFDAIGAGSPHNFDHGTAMAGAIAARGQVQGVAPSVKLLSARAFDSDGQGGALGSSVTIMKAIDWAARVGAQVINMSFAGPRDPALHDMLAAASHKGLILIGAMGNAGRQSPPLFPAADANVIAITATDVDDKPYDMANIGAYVAAAAPGVDVLLPAPNGGYSLETGTSVSAALASGVAALALERKPHASAQDMRRWLTTSAHSLGPDQNQFGAGLIDAAAAVRATQP